MIDSITLLLVILNVIVSLAAFSEQRLFMALLFEPFVIKSRGEWHRFISHAFIHANWPHLLVNMFVLYMFGVNVEYLYYLLTGRAVLIDFLVLYIGGILLSSIPAYRRHIHDPAYRAVGASGAVSAVLFAQILMLPTSEVQFIFIPVPIPAWIFGILYLVYSWYMDKRGGDNVAHDAHFYGAVWGIAYTAFLDPDLVMHVGAFQRSLGL